MNPGKVFEQQWKKSADKCEGLFYYRFKDSPSSWGAGQGVRFTNDNICDIMMFSSPKLFLIELKETKEKNFTFDNVRENQRKGLLEVYPYNNICAGIIIYFSILDECYFIDIKTFNDLRENIGRKSIPIKWFRENALSIDVIPLRVNRMYNVKKFVEEMKERN